jgi:hypothetical protein
LRQNGSRSDEPAEMHLRVGIDPYGGTDPFSANVIWSPEKPAFDHWVQFSVQAQAKGSAVTVFTHSRAEWDYTRVNNDVYLDDASLIVVEEEPPTRHGAADWRASADDHAGQYSHAARGWSHRPRRWAERHALRHIAPIRCVI